MTRRKGELNPAGIDRGWPHQVALPADRVNGQNHKSVHDFRRDLSLCRSSMVFCFADPAHAELFRAKFNGERFDPKDRGRGSNWHQWRKR